MDLPGRGRRDPFHRVRVTPHSRAGVPGQLVVRRIPDLNTEKNKAAGQETLFDTWRFHAFFTTVTAEAMNTATADKPTAGTRSSNKSTPT